MFIEIEIRKGFKFEIKINAKYENDVVLYQAQLVTGFISYFNNYDIYQGTSIEESISKISKALEDALKQTQMY